MSKSEILPPLHSPSQVEAERIVRKFLCDRILVLAVQWSEPGNRAELAKQLELWSVGMLEGRSLHGGKLSEELEEAFSNVVSSYHKDISGSDSGFDPRAGF